MIRFGFIIFCLICSFDFFKAQTGCDPRSILYGAHAQVVPHAEQNITRVFMDKNGFFYPDTLLDNDSIRYHCGSIELWLLKNPAVLKKVSFSYGLAADKTPAENVGALRSAILERLTGLINTQAVGCELVDILIHGFRKPFQSKNGDSSSVSDYKGLRNEILKSSSKKHAFIEVYWDGMYDCCVTWKWWQNDGIFLLFEKQATSNAKSTGLELRNLVSAIRSPHLNIITHSLGAAVACELLFNTGTTETIIEKERRYKTPGQTRIDVCMLGPAIASAIFKDYYNRNSSLSYKKHDNYFLYIGYNEMDFVLLKKDPKYLKFGPGAYKYGVTTLGCNANKDVPALQEMFKADFSNSSLRAFDLRGGVCHFFRCYYGCNNFPAMLAAIED